jgi:hypothetical protein
MPILPLSLNLRKTVGKPAEAAECAKLTHNRIVKNTFDIKIKYPFFRKLSSTNFSGCAVGVLAPSAERKFFVCVTGKGADFFEPADRSALRLFCI